MATNGRLKRIWLYFPRWLRIFFVVFSSIFAGLALVAAICWWYIHPAVERTDGVQYGERNGKPLMLDVVRPNRANGRAIALMVSGGWRSQEAGEAPTWIMAPLLRRGYTLFPVYHISQPEATVMEIIQDMHRSIRFIRHHADKYDIEPTRIGVTGGSAGGHLSLMLATRGGLGPAASDDVVERESSEVQAVAIFYPVTDLLNLGDSTENPGDGGPPKSFVKSFGPTAQDMNAWKKIGHDCSPIYHLTSDLPPTLIYHGDVDTLVPLEQSERFRDRAAELGHDVKVVVHAGGEHGWPTMFFDLFRFADWFDVHLKLDN